MSEPLVCAILLTKDRPQMAARAVRAFREQTYPATHRRLLVLDTGRFTMHSMFSQEDVAVFGEELNRSSIGMLRNRAIELSDKDERVIIHWDDDDWSHPNRIAEQVAHLQSSGADVVGYNELLFWREAQVRVGVMYADINEAWILRNSQAKWGTSFCYWRKTWERKPFPDLPKTKGGAGEDSQWATGLNIATRTGLHNPLTDPNEDQRFAGYPGPRIICSIHGGNTSSYNIEEQARRGADWKRVPEWDSYCRSKMQI